MNLLIVMASAQAAIEPDFLMDSDPTLREPDPVKKFTRDFKGIWIQALERPETDMQRMAAETISRAHQYGVPGLIEAVPVLEKILRAKATHPAARFSAARALIVLESRSSAEKLLEASQDFGADLRQLVEPAMARWDVVAARAIWMKRLETPSTRPRDLILAIRGLGMVHETTALPTLLKTTLDLVSPVDLRLEAASAAGELSHEGLEQEADKLIQETGSPQLINRLCAIRLLSHHESELARTKLTELAQDAEPSIVAPALKRLNEIDPVLVLPLAEAALNQSDAYVREQAVFAYLSLPTAERIKLLRLLLADPQPFLRQQVCEGFYRLAQNPEWNESIRGAAIEVLAGERWQGQEQAALLLGQLEHKSAAMRLVELLESPRPEVMVASAWALRKVAVPASIPAMLDKAFRQTVARKMRTLPGVDHQVAHLLEACGQMKLVQARLLLLMYIPKDLLMGERSRGAAIWSLGWLHEGALDTDLGKALIGRVEDTSARPPESLLIRQQCVVALARMKAVDYAPAFQVQIAHGTPPTRLGLAFRWAVKQLTGEDRPEPVPSIADQGSWFLEPLP